MEIVVRKNDLLRELQLFQGIVERKNTIPILANVLIEAVSSGVPVLGSDIPGNRGMLGADYPGWFPVGDAARLADLISTAMHDPDYYAMLSRRCAERVSLFYPEHECAAVCSLLYMTR